MAAAAPRSRISSSCAGIRRLGYGSRPPAACARWMRCWRFGRSVSPGAAPRGRLRCSRNASSGSASRSERKNETGKVRCGLGGAKKRGTDGSEQMKIHLYIFTMLLGVVLAVHLAMNGKVGSVLNNPRVGNALFWCIGALSATIIGLTGWHTGVLAPLKQVHPLLLTAGVLGAC